MKGKKIFFEKVKEHETEIKGAITIVFMFGTVINLFKNGSKANDVSSPHVTEIIENNVNSINANGRVVNVTKHIRNLPEGWKASPEKINSAIKKGVLLETNQTWVDDYSKKLARIFLEK
ncbi:MAG: hypothetical protein K0B14_17910 [Anaerolineaceae bacterium]|nr:hypothetical protein [Anaerolineaceae bacterium]